MRIYPILKIHRTLETFATKIVVGQLLKNRFFNDTRSVKCYLLHEHHSFCLNDLNLELTFVEISIRMSHPWQK